jgi:hypothetical protein
MDVTRAEVLVAVNPRHLEVLIWSAAYLREKFLEGVEEKQNTSVVKPARVPRFFISTRIPVEEVRVIFGRVSDSPSVPMLECGEQAALTPKTSTALNGTIQKTVTPYQLPSPTRTDAQPIHAASTRRAKAKNTQPTELLFDEIHGKEVPKSVHNADKVVGCVHYAKILGAGRADVHAVPPRN